MTRFSDMCAFNDWRTAHVCAPTAENLSQELTNHQFRVFSVKKNLPRELWFITYHFHLPTSRHCVKCNVNYNYNVLLYVLVYNEDPLLCPVEMLWVPHGLLIRGRCGLSMGKPTVGLPAGSPKWGPKGKNNCGSHMGYPIRDPLGITVGLPCPHSPTVNPHLPTVGPHGHVCWVVTVLDYTN